MIRGCGFTAVCSQPLPKNINLILTTVLFPKTLEQLMVFHTCFLPVTSLSDRGVAFTIMKIDECARHLRWSQLITTSWQTIRWVNSSRLCLLQPLGLIIGKIVYVSTRSQLTRCRGALIAPYGHCAKVSNMLNVSTFACNRSDGQSFVRLPKSVESHAPLWFH